GYGELHVRILRGTRWAADGSPRGEGYANILGTRRGTSGFDVGRGTTLDERRGARSASRRALVLQQHDDVRRRKTGGVLRHVYPRRGRRRLSRGYAKFGDWSCRHPG